MYLWYNIGVRWSPPTTFMHVLYILKSDISDKLYIGTTNDIKRRFKEHSSDASKATKCKGPWSLIYCEVYRSKLDALERERKLKFFKNSYKQLKLRISRSLDA